MWPYSGDVAIYLVRHAHAGSRSTWIGDDRLRPLSDKGRVQSHTIADTLMPLLTDGAVLLSSPYLRCMQTLEPLAEMFPGDVVPHGIVSDARLGEEASIDAALALVDDTSENSVLCSHGNIIDDVMAALIRRGLSVSNGFVSARKGSIWIVHRRDGRWTEGVYLDR